MSKETFRNRIRSAKGAVRQIAHLSRRSREQLTPHYRRLLAATRATIRQAGQVLIELQTKMAQPSHQLIETLQTFLPRAEQALEQAQQRY